MDHFGDEGFWNQNLYFKPIPRTLSNKVKTDILLDSPAGEIQLFKSFFPSTYY